MLAHAGAAAAVAVSLLSIERRPVVSAEPFAAAVAAPDHGPPVLVINRRVVTTLPVVELIEAWAVRLLERGERFGLLDETLR